MLNAILIVLSAFTYYFYAAKADFEAKRFDEAYMTLLLCEKLNPEDGMTKQYLGMISTALSKPEQAKAYYAEAYRLAPDDLWESYAEALFRSGDKKERKQAIRIMERAARTHSKDPDTWSMLQNAYVKNMQFKDALRVQDKLDELKGYDEYSAYTRYQLYRFMNKPKDALKEVDHYLSLEPRDMEFQVLRVQLYEVLHVDWTKLEAAYQTLLEYNPYNMMLLNNYAYGLAINGGNLSQAESMSMKTLLAEPNNPVYLDTYAWILHLQGNDSLARFYIQKAKDNMGTLDDKELLKHYTIIMK